MDHKRKSGENVEGADLEGADLEGADVEGADVEGAEAATDPAVVVVGNPCDGFRFFGPFFSCEEANDWADVEMRNDEWWVSSMTPQKKRKASFSGVQVEIEGGVLQSCEVELQCSECGAVTHGDGYTLKDRDIDN